MKNLFKRTTTAALCALIPISIATASPQQRGGGSDGGGNTYKDKPLESYVKQPSQLAAFQHLIQPLLSNIKQKEMTNNSLPVLGNMLRSVFSQKIWYFVPGPLEHIPPDLLNSAVRTDQAILQGYDRVWVDEDIWNAMSVDDQAKLLLHEAFMGLKILQFASNQRLCEAAYGPDEDCRSNGTIDTNINLTSKDYLDVQKMTVFTSSRYASMTVADWMKLLREGDLKYPYNWFEEATTITPEEFTRLLTKSTVSGFMPSHGYNLKFLESEKNPPATHQDLYDYLQKNKEKCQIDAQVSNGNLILKLHSKTETFSEQIPLPSKIETSFDDLYRENKTLQRIGFGHITQKPRPSGGFTYYQVWMSFDSYRLQHVHIQEMACLDKDCNTPTIDVKDGTLYICSANSQLYKP